MSARNADELRALAVRGAAELAGASAEDILRWTDDRFGPNYVVASSMQDTVLVHLAATVRPGVGVLFLDTGYHFAETIGTRDAVAALYDVTMITVTPEQTVAEQDLLVGRNLFASDPDECCRRRKVLPLRNALRNYSAWVSGIRRAESSSRGGTPSVAFDESLGLVKVNPLADWTDHDVESYIQAHGVLVNPLIEEGYPSIGCEPCTVRPARGADPRSGRWQGLAKTECGLHA